MVSGRGKESGLEDRLAGARWACGEGKRHNGTGAEGGESRGG